MHASPEHERLHEPWEGAVQPWKKWGPYVSDRSWGTVREDYSPKGEAWDYFSHDVARSRAYRWGEDAIAGFCDRYQILVFAPVFWNEKDPILKERLYGLTPNEGNHGEDVKEYYFHLDATPTHSYMKFLYKYPQREFPYRQLIDGNRGRGPADPEYELLDTGIFDENRYFDIQIEYAKASPEDLCMRIEVFNRGPEDAPIHVLPHLWFRNTWSWGTTPDPRPSIRPLSSLKKSVGIQANDETMKPLDKLPFPYRLGIRHLYGPEGGGMFFTENETHAERVFGPHSKSASPQVKDAFHRHLIQGEDSVSKEGGSKACLHYRRMVRARSSEVFHFRLTDQKMDAPLKDAEAVVIQRRKEADQFYEVIQPKLATEDEKRVQRQALAGLLWSKQIYLFHVHAWLDGDNPAMPPPQSRKRIRNMHWMHLNSMRVMSMPDKWEYPWFAAWDLAFQCVPFALVDPDFAKEQLWMLLFEQFQHPNGQIPAYEWEFSDLNPPVHAWAVWRIYNMDRIRSGKADRLFLEKCFHKMLINFTWWVNKVDSEGNNVFEGGFLGLDNITVVDRSEKLPHGTKLEQSDATGWMGMFCLNMMRMALELARENKAYEGLATKFFQHYVYIGAAMKKMGGKGYRLWEEKDGFFYDVLRYPDGSFHKFRVRSLVGLIPMFAVERLEEDWIEPFPEFRDNLKWFLRHRKDVVQKCVTTLEQNGKRVHVLTIMDPAQMAKLMGYINDTTEFRSPYGLRSLSKYHEHHPFHFEDRAVRYEPAESIEKLKGGNSNWRGPLWFPTTFMLIESLRKLRKAYGVEFTAEGSIAGDCHVKLKGVARGFANDMIKIFTRDEQGRRPVYGDQRIFQEDPHWKDHILFFEYFHGDSGRGLGASHQTGWTALVASLIDEWRNDSP